MDALVNTHYSNIATAPSTSDQAAHAEKVALSFGYSLDDLATLPTGANLGLSCGNPLVAAGLREGETTVDLGCGAGFDVFLAARKVGPNGKAIGIDMSEAMISRAIASSRQPSSPQNVQFLQAPITSLPLPDSSTDCITSNCVVNLVPALSRASVFMEIFRVLKPGGRVAISDILARKPLPKEMEDDIGLWVGCVAGAGTREDYVGLMEKAGLVGIVVIDKGVDLNVYKEGSVLDFASPVENGTAESACCGTQPAQATMNKNQSCCGTATVEGSRTAPDIDFNEWVGSFSIYAIKPSN